MEPEICFVSYGQEGLTQDAGYRCRLGSKEAKKFKQENRILDLDTQNTNRRQSRRICIRGEVATRIRSLITGTASASIDPYGK